MCTVRNETGAFFSAKSDDAKKRGEWSRVLSSCLCH
jgi:hypothetical protein